MKDVDTVMNMFSPGMHLGAISEKAYDNFTKFCAKEKTLKHNLFESVPERKLFGLINAKYFNSLIHSGEGVGATAA